MLIVIKQKVYNYTILLKWNYDCKIMTQTKLTIKLWQ